MKKRQIMFLGALLVVLTLQLNAQTQPIKHNKSIVKTYKLGSETWVEVNNKYGKVEVINWDKDSVKFVINLETRAKTKEKLQKLEAILNFNFTGNETYVKAVTQIGSLGSDFTTEINNLTNAITTMGAEATIDYTVYLPSDRRLRVINSFGDIYLSDWKAGLEIDLSHGDFRVGNLPTYSVISVKFGKAFITYLKEGKVSVQFADLDLRTSEKLSLDSKSSTIRIESVKTLNLESKRDNIKIDKVTFLKGNLNFTKLFIDVLVKEVNLNTKFGSIDMEKVDDDFSGLTIVSGYTDMTLIFSRQASYTVNLLQTETTFTYPKELAKLSSQLINKDTKQYKITGTIGNPSNANSKLNITANKGSLRLIHK